MATSESLAWHQYDWVLSIGSNVHIAIDREWFTPGSFVEFESHVGKAPHSKSVKGVGTVELELASPSGGGCHKLALENVHYVPDFPLCNIIGGPILSAQACQYDLDFSALQLKMRITEEPVGLFDADPIIHLRLKGHAPGSSSFAPDVKGHLDIFVTWPGDEQARYKAFLAGEDYEQGSLEDEPPLDASEKAWLLKTYKGEYRFLVDNRLSIHKQDDRAMGHKLLREKMRENAATEKALVKEHKQSLTGQCLTEPQKDKNETVEDRGKENQPPVEEADKKPKSTPYQPPHMRVIYGTHDG